MDPSQQQQQVNQVNTVGLVDPMLALDADVTELKVNFISFGEHIINFYTYLCLQ